MATSRPFHPLLFAAFPVLALYASNAREVAPGEVLPALVAVGLLAAFLALLAAVAYRNLRKGAALASLIVILTLSHQYIYSALSPARSWSIPVGRHSQLLVLGALLVGVAAVALWRTRHDLAVLTRLLNVFGIMFVVVAGSNAVASSRRVPDYDPATRVQQVDLSGPGPDIYYFVLDAYGRADVLEETYGFDNQPFLEALEARGFDVAPAARSNYTQTDLSLASTLNMDYLDRIATVDELERGHGLLLRRMIRDSAVLTGLRRAGYRVVSFASGVEFSELENADVFASQGRALSEFENSLIHTTAIPLLLGRLGLHSRGWGTASFDQHRARILYALDNADEFLAPDAPNFVLVHVLAPHPPFVFRADGTPVNRSAQFSLADGSHYMERASRQSYLDGYAEQLEFLNARLLDAVDAILARQDRRSVIILQGDHGARSGMDWDDPARTDHREVFAILDAMRLPGDAAVDRPDSTSSVNTFRFVLDQVFGADLPLLPDRSFDSPLADRYHFEEIDPAAMAGDRPDSGTVEP